MAARVELGPDQQTQADLFAAPPDPRRAQLMATLDQLNQRYGRGTVRSGAAALTEAWQMRQDRRSPNYTTAWAELLEVC